MFIQFPKLENIYYINNKTRFTQVKICHHFKDFFIIFWWYAYN